MAGFLCLGLLWLGTTLKAYQTIRRGEVQAHQQWMIYSYAACFAAVTLRIWLPLLIIAHQGEFIPAYRIVAWLSWLPNVLLAWYINARRLPPTSDLR
jgi:hypothetical protein